METLDLYKHIGKEQAADLLQNDISQTLSAVLLWIQTAMNDEKQLAANQHLQLAESHLKTSVKKLVRLHYALLEGQDKEKAVSFDFVSADCIPG